MSNEHYDEFSKATIPGLTVLDRQLLGHYCARFNESVTPARAWPPLAELIRITGTHQKSISRSLGRLHKRSLLIRVTRASEIRGLKAEYAINRKLIRSYIQVTEELPNNDTARIQVTEETLIGNSVVLEGNSVVLEGNSVVPIRLPSGYPKPIKPIKPINGINQERFDFIISGQTKQVQERITPGTNYESLLDFIEKVKKIPKNKIKDAITGTNFTSAHKVGGLFEFVLNSLAGLPSTTNSPYAKRSPNVDKYEQKQPPAFNPEFDSFADKFGLPPD